MGQTAIDWFLEVHRDASELLEFCQTPLTVEVRGTELRRIHGNQASRSIRFVSILQGSSSWRLPSITQQLTTVPNEWFANAIKRAHDPHSNFPQQLRSSLSVRPDEG